MRLKRLFYAKRITDQAFAAVIRQFRASPKFAGYASSTQKNWGRELRLMEDPDGLGGLSVFEIRPALVQAFFDGLAELPGKQGSALAVLRQLEAWAIVRDLLPQQITLGVEIGSSDHHHIPWSSEQVALGEQHLPPYLSRWVTLGANTGQRSSDLARMGPTDLEIFNGIEGIRVIQQKTKREVWVPIASELAAAMATWERRPGPWLLNREGMPWSTASIWTAFTYWRDKLPALQPLAGLVPHGLRGHACVRLRRSGASILQIADMVGMSPGMVERYCKGSSQRENASAAVVHLDRTIRERADEKAEKKGA